MSMEDATAEERLARVGAASKAVRPQSWSRLIDTTLLLLAAVFFALHFVHLKADFPNHSPWMDWAKYTDEGWYGDAAIRHYERGHWYVAGDFNPAAALPVWPALELVLFRFTGVSLVAARGLTVCVFALILMLAYLLIRWWDGKEKQRQREWNPSLSAATAVLVLAVSPFCFVFSRVAILEPLLILLTLAALYAASAVGTSGEKWRTTLWSVSLGLLLSLIVLTKTTGLFLFPAVFWMLWAASKYHLRSFVRAAVVVCGTGAVAWGMYYFVFVRPRYLEDYRYLFSANAYTGITLATFWQVLHDAVIDLSWMGITLSVLSVVAVLLTVGGLAARRRANPLAVASLLWIFGYGAFLAYHANLQPRYYLVLAIPLTMLTAMEFGGLIRRALGGGAWPLRIAAVASAAALLFAAANGARQTLAFISHPQYEWWNAAQQVSGVVRREPGHSQLLLSISGSDISLMTGLHSICDDFGTMPLVERVATYRPGWFATWNDVEDDKMEALAPLYRLERVASIPVFDDPDRNLLILYRLDPLGTPGPRTGNGRRHLLSVPRRLRTTVGDQPSVVQLRH